MAAGLAGIGGVVTRVREAVVNPEFKALSNDLRFGQLDQRGLEAKRVAGNAARRPHVRGVAMNPVDHPLGGGEGKAAGGRHPVSPWGMPTKGYKTRGKKPSDRFIVQRRRRRK